MREQRTQTKNWVYRSRVALQTNRNARRGSKYWIVSFDSYQGKLLIFYCSRLTNFYRLTKACDWFCDSHPLRKIQTRVSLKCCRQTPTTTRSSKASRIFCLDSLLLQKQKMRKCWLHSKATSNRLHFIWSAAWLKLWRLFLRKKVSKKFLTRVIKFRDSRYLLMFFKKKISRCSRRLLICRLVLL